MARKVLVLEDESSIRSFIVINLTRAGYEVIEAETGEEALEKLKEHTASTVLKFAVGFGPPIPGSGSSCLLPVARRWIR